METVYRMKRRNLRWLMQRHPTWSCRQLAEAVEMSLGWVKKWRRRLKESEPEDEQVLHSRSRAPKHPRARISEQVVARVLALRDEPPEGLRRVPGPKALAYYLPRDPALQQLQAQGDHLPRSTHCIYLILKRAGRIAERPRCTHEPLERPEPLQEWQLDFKDASSVPADPQGKQQHVVEVLNIIDVGTSHLLDAHVGADFHAETALQAIVQTFQRWGRPREITTDRDVRLVGSPQGSDFPSALRRLCACLGIDYVVCPPQRPDRNAFEERYHRSFQQECLSLEQPRTMQEVAESTSRFVEHYNQERPNQALTCHNQPPAVAHPHLPVLPSVPLSVDPDSWLRDWDGWQVRRLVSAQGSVKVDVDRYYVSTRLAGQWITVHLDATEKRLHFWHQGQLIRSQPLKGLMGEVLPWSIFVATLSEQARSQERRRRLQVRRMVSGSDPSP
jgi:hypothetical protein